MVKRLSDRDYADMMNSTSVQRALDKRASSILEEARRRTPEDSGDAKRSLTVEFALRDDGVLVRRIGWDLDIAEYGPYLEFGTEDTLAVPALRVAAAAKSPRRAG